MRIFSGIQPTGQKHLGNYIGGFRQYVATQELGEGFFCIVDLHSISVDYDPQELRKTTLDLAAMLFAVGLDPDRSTVFVQSHVAAHPEANWLLGSVTSFGELRRMTQFKEKSAGQGSVSVGLFDYPVLQAADVLLYNAHRVPVGDDQRQHLELMRDVAIRFNGRFGDTFVVPEASIPRVGARIMDLQEPTRKMSKTGGTELGTIWLSDPPSRLKKKIMAAVTDSGSEVRADPEAKPGVTALLEIMATVTDTPIPALESRYAVTGYGTFKKDVLDALVAFLEPIQARHDEMAGDPAEVRRALERSADRAREIAVGTMATVRDAVGLLP